MAQSMDLLPQIFKQQVKEKYEKHIEWLRPQDHLTRAYERIRISTRLHDEKR